MAAVDIQNHRLVAAILHDFDIAGLFAAPALALQRMTECEIAEAPIAIIG